MGDVGGDGTGGGGDGDVLLTEVVDRIGIITLNRPERRNALDGRLVAALDAAVTGMADDRAVRVVVLTGAAPPGGTGGTGGFCSGGDTKRDPGADAGMELGVPPNALEGDLARHDRHAAMLLHLMPKPTIAMVGGPAVGAGCSLAAACDLRFASEDAIFMAGFTPNGLSGDYGGTLFWTRIAGTAVARRLYLLNERLTARQALELGMVHAVLPPAELRPHTLDVAARLARIPRHVVARVKDNLNQAEDEADRRRFLFAHEAHNQLEAGRLTAERLARRAR
ncbi:MAG TPA: enoyl-CoA hydratase-related protein [Acidimicrobiales bacterium]